MTYIPGRKETCHEPGACCAYCCLIEVELSVGEFGTQLCDGSINASNI
jgi:hypothetical protein